MNEWREVRLGDVLDVENRRLGVAEIEPPVLSVTKDRGLVRADEYFDKRIASVNLSQYKIVIQDGWAFSTIHIDEGSIARNALGYTGVVSPMYTTMRWTGTNDDPEYYELLLKSPQMKRQYFDNAQGTVNRRRSLPFKTFAGLRVQVPSLPEQRRIVDLIGALDALIEALDAERQSVASVLAALRDSYFVESAGDRTEFRHVATLQRGYDLPVQQRQAGSVPVVASNGPVGTHDKSMVPGPGVVTGRSGTIGKVMLVSEDFWPLNTTLFVKDFHGNDRRFVRHLLVSMRLESHAGGSTVPSLNRNVLDGVEVYAPDLSTQSRIASELDALDDLVGMLYVERERGQTLRGSLLGLILSGEVEIPESYDALLREAV
jgi:type I restriction enzyme, S subunit